jgi:3-methyladenine DNA glycosylase Mpg
MKRLGKTIPVCRLRRLRRTELGVLLRALEPLEGIDRMQRLRGGAGLLDLARGPGRLAQAMQIDLRQDGVDLCAAGPLWLGTSRRKTGAIGTSVRIGLTRSVDRELRFYERGNREWSKEVTRVGRRFAGGVRDAFGKWRGFIDAPTFK